MKQAITTIIILVLFGTGSAQDTTIRFSVPYRFVVQGTRTGTIAIPLPKKDTIRIHDTIYINTCPPNPPISKDTMFWSKQNIPFQKFIDSAITINAIPYLDRDVIPAITVNVDGDLTLVGNGSTITGINKYVFVLGKGKHTFQNINVVQTVSDGASFVTRPTANILWTNTFKDVKIYGGGQGYISSRGGNDTAWAGTTFENCIVKVSSVGISVFSQDGNKKYLHLKNVQVGTDTSHGIYVHPSVSLWYDSLAPLPTGVGKLLQHQYSGGELGYSTARYSRFSRVFSNGEMFEMTSLKSGYVEIENCDLAPFKTDGVMAAKVWATNSRFYNAGNGIVLAGTLYNCNGGAWSTFSDTLRIVGGNYGEVSMRNGGVIITDSATIDYMSVADRGINFEGLFNNSIIKTLQDGRRGDGILYLRNTPKPAPYFGQPYRPEIINSLNRDNP